MKKIILPVFLMTLLGSFLFSCESNKGELPSPSVINDSVSITYTHTIKKIMERKCYVGSDGDDFCHGSNAGSQSFATYAGITKPYYLSRFSNAVNHRSGALPMPYPQGSAKIPQAEIDTIDTWLSRNNPE
jgi:hypothetical protein